MDRPSPLRRLTKSVLPRTLPMTIAEETTIPSLPAASTTSMVAPVSTNVNDTIVHPIKPVSNVSNIDKLPSSTIMWSGEVQRTVFAGDDSLSVYGYVNYLEASRPSLIIKTDGVYCLQIMGENCNVKIESCIMYGVENNVVLSDGKNFTSICCFLRKNDCIRMSATSSVSNNDYRSNPNIRRRPTDNTNEKPKSKAMFSVTLMN